MNLAIVIGVEKYKFDTYDNLPACRNDARAFRDVLSDVKEFDEILYLNNDEPAHELKKSITEFIERHKESNISELVYYFSGHGERHEEDFLYLPSDFEKNKPERTGLRNSELDSWIKNLSPKLFVKIIDACFSGTQYVKSESSEELDLTASAKKYGFNDIYFLFSSRSNEKSYAGENLSHFTESILLSILDQEGDIRYRDIMDYIADDFFKSGKSRPTFITQSGNIEKFGLIKESTRKIISAALGLDDSAEESEPSATDTTSELHDGDSKAPEKTESIIDKLIAASTTSCFSEERLSQFLAHLTSSLSEWGDDLNKLYEIKTEKSSSSWTVPNAVKIGAWLESMKDGGYFAKPTYRAEEYEVEEYKALPKKPRNNLDSIFRDNLFQSQSSWLSSLYNKDKTEYKLEKIKKERLVLDGFEYTHRGIEGIINIKFSPKIELIDAACVHIVPIYSNREMVINFSYEFLQRRNWKVFSEPYCPNWKSVKVHVSKENSEISTANHFKKNIEEWILESLSKVTT